MKRAGVSASITSWTLDPGELSYAREASKGLNVSRVPSVA